MQRYRVNYPLLGGLVAGTLVVAVVAYFVHSWQVNRKATWFRDRSQNALAQQEYLEAFDYLQKYVSLRKDEVDAQVQLASISTEIIKSEDTTREEKGYAFSVLEETVRRTGDPELKRELAEMIIGQRPQDALTHIEDLLQENPQDSELLAMQAQAYYQAKDFRRAVELCYRLVGYNKEEDTFSAENASAKDRPEVYSLLAGLLYEREDEPELARRVIDQMVEANPDSARAYLNQAVFLRTVDDDEEAAAALDKAYELDPDDERILQQKGTVAMADEEYEKAEEFFLDAVEKHPDRTAFYRLLAMSRASQDRQDDALETLNKGIQKFGSLRAFDLTKMKLDLLFQQGDFEAVNNELKKLTQLNLPRLEPFIEFNRARIKWQEQKWTEAADALRKIRPLLIDFPQQRAMAGAMLANCYEKLGKPDLAVQTYDLVLQDYPNYDAAVKGKENAQRMLGVNQDEPAFELDRFVEEMAARPEEEQDWSAVEELVEEIVEQRGLSEARTKLLRANILLKRDKFEEAKQLIREAAMIDPEDMNVRFAAVSLVKNDPTQGPDTAMQLLDKLVEKFGDSLRARVTRADLLAAQNEEDVVQQLEALTEGIEQWSDREQAQLYTTLASRFERLRELDKAREYWLQAIELLPNNLPLRMHLFDLALQQRDEEQMRKAQELILEIVQDENDSNYILTEVKRRIMAYSQQKVLKAELQEARHLLDTALVSRPQWHELHVLYGQLLLLLEEDPELALRHLEDALKYGPPNANAVSLQVKLLAQRGQLENARDRMRLIPEESRLQLLGRTAVEILLRTGEEEQAFEYAQELSELEKDNATSQEWFARIARDLDKTDAAIQAFRRATELQPSDAENWMQLVAIYAKQQDTEKVQQLLREAQLAIEADFLPLLTAKKHELRGDWKSAERMYLANFEGRLDELSVARRMAEFYLLWNRAGSVSSSKAAPYINTILRKAYEGEASKSNTHVAWARQQAARLLAAAGDYQSFQHAQQVLEKASPEGQLSREDRSLLVEMLASRPEPEAQLKALNLLNEMQSNQTIGKKGIVMLAQLLNASGQGDRAESLLLDAISRYRDDPEIWTTYIEVLIAKGDYSIANSRIDRLQDITQNKSQVLQLRLRLASKRGNQGEIGNLLQSMLPSNVGGAMDEKQLQNVLSVAQMAAQFEEVELADQLYRLYVRRVPEERIRLARFLALHGDPDEAMEMLKALFDNQPDEVIQIASQMLRQRRSEFGDQYDEDVNQLVSRALRDDPESFQRNLIHAEVLELQERYDESVAVYDGMLSRGNLPSRMRAAAMNNLAFQLVLLNQRLDEAAQLINQAIEIYGPVADMLDTRALVNMARQEYDAAMEDMKLATTFNEDPVKYYHLARASVLAGHPQEALTAWDKALELGFTNDQLNTLEQASYEQFKQQIDGLRSQNASL